MVKRLNYTELFERLFTGVIITGFSTLTILFLMVVKGDQQLRLLEEAIMREEVYVQEERISVEESVKRYIDSLPIPEPLVIEETEEVEIRMITTEESVTVVETREAESIGNTICEDDVLLLAKLMHAEEGVLRAKLPYEEAKQAHMLCGSVILNRLNMKHLGDTTIEEVIYAPGQYACTENLNQAVPEETIEWARELIENGPIGPNNMIYQAEFEQGSSTYAHIGNQYFCCK